MRPCIAVAISFAGLLVIGLLVVERLSVRNSQRKREAYYAEAVATYSRDLKPEMHSNAISDYIYAHGAMPERDSQPDTPASNDMLVRLGEEEPPWYCSRVVNYLQIRLTDDKYGSTSLKREAQDCM